MLLRRIRGANLDVLSGGYDFHDGRPVALRAERETAAAERMAHLERKSGGERTKFCACAKIEVTLYLKEKW